MLKFDHLAIPVADLSCSRAWYVETLGLEVEFEIPERRAVALNDSDGFAIFLEEVAPAPSPQGTALWFRVDDVEATCAQMSGRGVEFAHLPQKTYWGYGAELVDPDGYRLRLWEERSMRER